MQISQRDKRALQAAGAALLLFVAFRFGIFPTWDRLQEVRTNLPIRQKTLEKYREAIQAAEFRRAEIASLEARLQGAEASLLDNQQLPLSFAELQELMKQFLAARSIDVRSSAFLPVMPLGSDYLQVPLGLQFQCRLDQLVNFLEDIERSQKRLSISRLLIQAANPQEKLISVNMNVAGITRASATQGRQSE